MWIPDFLKNISSANYGMWNSPTPGLHPDGSITPGEGGVDIGTPNGTPVYAIADGLVVGSGYWKDNAHGVITTRVDVPGAGPQDLYYQHIQLDPSIKVGQTVKRGQRIGVIGPLNEIEMGFNAQWGQPWGTNHPGPWIADPRPWINAILGGSGAAPAQTATLDFNPLDPSSWWPSIAPRLVVWGEYIAVFILAVVLIIIGFVLIGGDSVVKAVAS